MHVPSDVSDSLLYKIFNGPVDILNLANFEVFFKTMHLVFIIDRNGIFIDYKANQSDLFIEPTLFLGKNVVEVMPERVSSQILESINKTIASGELVQMIYDLDVKGGNRHYNARFYPLDGDKVICFVIDITDSIENVNKIKHLLVAQEATTTRLQNFTHIVSHNLRSHTANFQALFYLIQDEYPELLENEYLVMLKNSAENLNDTIIHLNQVLDINETSTKVWESVNLSKCIESNAISISQLASINGVNIQNLVDPHVEVKVIHAYLDSIVLNLMTNAIKYRSDDRESFLRITCSRVGDDLVVEFMDNGLGIDLRKYGQKIFGMYKTFHRHPDAKGLGLFMTKTQIEAMGGSIEVDSEPGIGTTFRVMLPVSAA